MSRSEGIRSTNSFFMRWNFITHYESLLRRFVKQFCGERAFSGRADKIARQRGETGPLTDPTVASIIQLFWTWGNPALTLELAAPLSRRVERLVCPNEWPKDCPESVLFEKGSNRDWASAFLKVSALSENGDSGQAEAIEQDLKRE